jgi:hypothetical protein
MEFYVIFGTASNLIKSYLQNIYYRVLVDYSSKIFSSEWESIKDGFPQGSILGRQLFVLYVNGLPSAISNIPNPILYANTNLIITNSDGQNV